MSLTWLQYKNDMKLKSRGNYGVRVARPGFDAGYCADNQLLFNSGWPILQLCKVVNIAKKGKTWVRYENPSNGSFTDTLPAGYTKSYEYPPDKKTIQVNRKYLRVEVNTIVYQNSSNDTYIGHEYKRARHNMGFVPFIIPAGEVSGVESDKVLIFNIDIQGDVDYPYTEDAMPLLKAPRDYGMKSKSIFGGRVSGLSTGQFSKLVQAVKTEKTALYNQNTTGSGEKSMVCVWSPLPRDYDKAVTGNVLEPYECYVFTAMGGFDYTNYDDGGDGGVYYTPEAGSYMYEYDSDWNTAGVYAFAGVGQAATYNVKQSMVILRNPMVSPEYEGVTV